MTDTTTSAQVIQEDTPRETVVATGSKGTNNVIRKTQDYSIFKGVVGNRKVNEKHVEELVARMQEHDFHEDDPINVTQDMEIIDGQHRLEARARLGRPVYYKVSKAMRPEDIAVVNSTNANWKLGDFIAYHIAKGNEEYIKLVEFADKWNILPYNAIGLLSGNSAQPGGKQVKEVERGEFHVVNLEHAERVMEHVEEFMKFLPYAKSKAFLNAVTRLLRLPSYNPEEMLEKAKASKEDFTVKYNNVMSWISLLERVYNHRRPKGSAVNFRVA